MNAPHAPVITQPRPFRFRFWFRAQESQPTGVQWSGSSFGRRPPLNPLVCGSDFRLRQFMGNESSALRAGLCLNLNGTVRYSKAS